MCPSFSWNYFPFVAIWDHPICLTHNTSRSLSHWPPLAKKKKKKCHREYDFSFCEGSTLAVHFTVVVSSSQLSAKGQSHKGPGLVPLPFSTSRGTYIVSMTHTGLLERLQPNAKEEKGGRIWALTERITELLTVMSVGLITFAPFATFSKYIHSIAAQTRFMLFTWWRTRITVSFVCH